MGIIKWFKELAFVVANFRTELSRIRGQRLACDNMLLAARSEMAALRKMVRDRTEVSASIGMHPGENYVVVCGKYRGVDYVETFNLPGDSLREIVDHLRHLKQFANVRRIDAAPHIKKIITEEMRYEF